MSIFNKIIDLQKLNQAWQRVRKNHPACGVDEITWQDFDANQKAELYQLHMELKEGRYEPLPVREITLYKGEKARNISLFSMRDKVVHQSIANELEKIFEPKFSPRCFAYRPNKSAMIAATEIGKAVLLYPWALKTDIHQFFDAIVQQRLLNLIKGQIKEEDVIDLIKTVLQVRILDRHTGQLIPKH